MEEKKSKSQILQEQANELMEKAKEKRSAARQARQIEKAEREKAERFERSELLYLIGGLILRVGNDKARQSVLTEIERVADEKKRNRLMNAIERCWPMQGQPTQNQQQTHV